MCGKMQSIGADQHSCTGGHASRIPRMMSWWRCILCVIAPVLPCWLLAAASHLVSDAPRPAPLEPPGAFHLLFNCFARAAIRSPLAADIPCPLSKTNLLGSPWPNLLASTDLHRHVGRVKKLLSVHSAPPLLPALNNPHSAHELLVTVQQRECVQGSYSRR